MDCIVHGVAESQTGLSDSLSLSSVAYRLPCGSAVKNLPSNAGDVDLIPGWGGEGNGNPLQNSYLGNPMDRSLVGRL